MIRAMSRKFNLPRYNFSKSAKLWILILVVTFHSKCFQTQDLICCSEASGACKDMCDKISLMDLAVNKKILNETLHEMQRLCSVQMFSFWECLNGTLLEISHGYTWSGRTCCPLPQNENCRRACIAATSIYDISNGCRLSDELDFFSCLDRQLIGEECCSHAQSFECKDACLDIFQSKLTPTKHQRTLVVELCQSNSPKVLNCIGNFTQVTPATNLHKHVKCCDKSQENRCKQACKRVMMMSLQQQNDSTLQEIFDALEMGGCGPPLLQDELWQCFIKPVNPLPPPSSIEISRIDRVGMDSAKWHCCQRATSNECIKLCSKTFTKDWSLLWDDFYYKCLLKSSEQELRNCIDEVDEPCELGCDGLSFCTNYNNRPTELFRSCTSQADEAARNDFTLWQTRNQLNLPDLVLPFKNASKCSPGALKAIACALQIKPCSRDSHVHQFCSSVCLELLTECADWTQIPSAYSPESVCTTLSAEGGGGGGGGGDSSTPCVDLKGFLEPPKDNYLPHRVSFPCKGEPCRPNQLCVVNKLCNSSNKPCLPYECIPGCKLGEVSEYVVPVGVYVRVPISNGNHHQRGCLKICKCTDKGVDQCQPLPCVLLSPCWTGSSDQKPHGQVFYIDCNKCICFAGEIICSKRQCGGETNSISGENAAYTTLPCNCPKHHVPVCGKNGNAYASTCLARCAGLADSDIDYGACQDPCKGNPCPIGKKCIPDVKVCLSTMHRPCVQYQCINGSTNCAEMVMDPVCDVDNRQHLNACYLAYHNKILQAYSGPCRENCNYKGGEVCGINGRTYISECAAFADYVSVDYKGACKAIGLINMEQKKGSYCPDIHCEALPNEDCFGVTPPGACCPVCGGGSIRILYSKKQIDRALYVLQTKSTFSLTLRALLMALERHIRIARCTLKGYLTVENDIFVLVKSTDVNPSKIQSEACMREAEKLANLINKQSPRIASELSLSSLLTATIVHTQRNTSSSLTTNTPSASVFTVVLTYVFCTHYFS